MDRNSLDGKTVDRDSTIDGLQHVADMIHEYTDKPWIHTIEVDCELILNALALLKEQEPIEPDTDCDGSEDEYSYRSWWYVCKACGGQIDYEDDYCRHCGRPQKWKDE